MEKSNFKHTVSKMLMLAITLFFFTSCSKETTDMVKPITELTDTVKKGSSKTNQGARIAAASNAAPSQHLVYSFPDDAILKMQKVKITQTALTEYFSIHNYAGGYAGLQHTPDQQWSTPYTLITSLWDPNTAGGVFATASYIGAGTVSSRFGGEGDGAKTINPYGWTINTWYNIVLRSWKANGKLEIATFIQNVSTGNWFHTATLAMPERTTFLGAGNGAFMENWVGDVVAYDGHNPRKAYFKDCWNMNTSNVWQKHTSRYFSANANDAARNGIYDNSFNAGFDAAQDAYFMEHGAGVTPNSAFGGLRTLTLPAQTNQGSLPTLPATTGTITAVSASYTGSAVNVNWTNSSTTSPQLSSKVEILNSGGTVVSTSDVTLPQRRSVAMTISLAAGNYTARVTVTNIFNQVVPVVTAAFTVGSSGTITNGTYRFVNLATGKSLDNMGISTNGASVAQYVSNAGNNQKWVVALTSGYYRISCVTGGKSLDSGNNTADGSAVIQYTNNSGTNQQWSLTPTGDGYFYIVNRTNGKRMDSAGGTTDGSLIKFWTASGSNAQKWSIVVP